MTATGVLPGRIPLTLHAYSIDAVAAVTAWHALVVVSLLPTRGPVLITPGRIGLMAATVWLIYTRDRLDDAAVIDPTRPHTLRHAAHRRHAVILRRIWWAISAAVAGLAPWALSPGEFVAALVGIVGVAGYFAWLRRPGASRNLWVKEVAIASLMAYGVGIPAVVRISDARAGLATAVTLVVSAGMFLMNCVSVSDRERLLDSGQGFPSGGWDVGDRRFGRRLATAGGLIAAVLVGRPSGVPGPVLLAATAAVVLMSVGVSMRPPGASSHGGWPLGGVLDFGLVAAAVLGLVACV